VGIGIDLISLFTISIFPNMFPKLLQADLAKDWMQQSRENYQLEY
jgi:hypothetical protein